jgi:glutamate dehydrogenase/leucine dehydrogenase
MEKEVVSVNINVNSFANQLLIEQVCQGVIWFDETEGIKVSNPVFSPIADAMKDLSDYDSHEAVFIKYDEETNCMFFIFVHNTIRGQAQGGTRMRPYATIEELLQDGLRLSRAMTEKNAVAELWWGGGKAIICPLDELNTITGEKRTLVFKNYGRFVASLNGIYIAAEDMNTTPQDMLQILSACRFVTCLPPDVGGSSNPSIWTARGIFNAILATLQFYEGSKELKGKTIGIQGVGNVGMNLAKSLLDAGANIVAYDINKQACEAIKGYSTRVKILEEDGDIYHEKMDIFSPCAGGAIINADTIPQLQATYVIGAANNQLESPKDDANALADRGIVYLPDYFINRMGIINCANEQYGWLKNDLEVAMKAIYVDTLRLLTEASKKNVMPIEISTKEASEKAKKAHPIWGHRGKLLLKEIIRNY